ncbi:PAS domain-containing protein [Thalassobaculum fulvum]|uniref:PAS domain-containing protein n=1 Tax=Thalassobaculum fulvum TaxID=1633335 RepID=UPI0016724703|nr:PAS domain-containing protein [Thalassobaculum fulvum]
MSEGLNRPPWYFVDFDMQVANRRLVDIYNHWRSIRDGGDVPPADRWDPLDLVQHLGHLFVVRVEAASSGDPAPDLRYTLIGTYLVDALGRDTTGRLVGDTFPEGHPVVSVYHRAIARRAPVRTHGRLDWVDKKYRSFESVLLPLAGADGRIAKFAGAAVYETSERPVVG